MGADELVLHRLESLEGSTKEQREETRDLLRAVASLAQNVAVMAEKVNQLTDRMAELAERPVTSAPPSVVQSATGGAVAGGGVAGVIEAIRLFLHQ